MTLFEEVNALSKYDAIRKLLYIIQKKEDKNLNMKEKYKREIAELKEKAKEKTLVKKIKDPSERFLEIKKVESNSSKITFNPVTGRITLKISNQASIIDGEKFIEIIKIIKNSNKRFAPFTYRGKICVNKTNAYGVCMQTSSKLFKSVYFKIS